MNYFAYFTEIEERFNARRGTLLMLSTLDWALIETWREAGVPLEAVLRGIDDAFDKYDARRAAVGSAGRTRLRKVNGLAWCAQAVMMATERMQEAATGVHKSSGAEADAGQRESGFEAKRVRDFLRTNAQRVRAAAVPEGAKSVAAAVADRLEELATGFGEADTSQGKAATSEWSESMEVVRSQSAQAPGLDDLDRTLTVLEERLLHAVMHAAPEDEIVAMRAECEREMAAFRGRLRTEQMRAVQQQYMTRKLTERYALPRLSLFYMSVGE